MSHVDERIQAHWAVQILSADADRKLAHRPDDSHTNMEWRGHDGALVAQTGLGLRLADLTLVRDGDTFELHGKTLAEGLEWASAGPVRDYDMPSHAVQGGAPFSARPAWLATWFTGADTLLRDLAARAPRSLPVRLWPHHFDLASITYLDDKPPAEAAQLGFGLSPGDNHYPSPYWYLTPWPLRADATLLPLEGGGQWHQVGFTGAVLVDEKNPARVRAFFASAFAAGRALTL